MKKCVPVNVLLFLALQMVCFAKTSDMIPPVFSLVVKRLSRSSREVPHS